MKTFFMAEDETVFATEDECRQYEADMMRTVEIPVKLLQEVIAQATPYLVTAKERRELKAKLERYLPHDDEKAIQKPPQNI